MKIKILESDKRKIDALKGNKTTTSFFNRMLSHVQLDENGDIVDPVVVR